MKQTQASKIPEARPKIKLSSCPSLHGEIERRRRLGPECDVSIRPSLVANERVEGRPVSGSGPNGRVGAISAGVMTRPFAGFGHSRRCWANRANLKRDLWV